MSIMDLANRIPLRIQRLNQLFGESYNCEDDEGESAINKLNDFKKVRLNLIKSGSRKLEKSEPRIKIARCANEDLPISPIDRKNYEAEERVNRNVAVKVEQDDEEENDNMVDIDNWYPNDDDNQLENLDGKEPDVENGSILSREKSTNCVHDEQRLEHNPQKSKMVPDLNAQSSSKKAKRIPFWCDTCSIQCSSFSSFRLHKSSKSHMSNTFGKLLTKERETSSVHQKEPAPEKIRKDENVDKPTANLESTSEMNLRKTRKRSYPTTIKDIDAQTATLMETSDVEDSSSNADDDTDYKIKDEWDDDDCESKNERESPKELKPDEFGEDGLYNCEFCDKCFKSDDNLQNHRKIYHRSISIDLTLEELQPVNVGKGGFRFVCPILKCSQSVKTREDLNDHLNNHGDFNCLFCEDVIDYAPDLAIHESTNHVDQKEVDGTGSKMKCSRCTSTFSTKPKLTKHFLESHLNLDIRDPRESCDICGFRMVSGSALERHFDKFHKTDGMDPSEVQNCDQCPAYFLTVGQLFIHKYHKHYEQKCPECGKCFTQSAHLKYHLKNSHPPNESEARKKPCHFCQVEVPTMKMLEHVQGHIGDYAIKCSGKACTFVAPNSLLLYRHLLKAKCRKMEGHKLKELRTCEECGFEGETIRFLQFHLKRNHERGGNKDIKCPMTGCEASFCVRQSVDFHLEAHMMMPKTEVQKCEHCPETVNVEGMEKHLRERHDASEIRKCQHCPFLFSSRYALINHSYVHRKNGVSCDICNNGAKYFLHAQLRDHYAVFHQVESKGFICEFCSKKFSFECNLAFHQKTCSALHQEDNIPLKPEITVKKKKQYPCDLCFDSKIFDGEKSLISHKISVHGAEPFTCSYCQKKFTSTDQLSRHQLEHQGVEFRKEWRCEVDGCGKVFKNKRCWTGHKLGGHSSVKPYVCETCGKSYINSNGLKHHNKTTHLKLRPWVCDDCGEAFTSTTVLKRHKLIHTGERPFKCEICGQGFRQINALQVHVKSHEEKGSNFRPTGSMKHIRKRKNQ